MGDEGSEPIVLVAANSAWNITNFRLNLIEAIKRAGYRPLIAAPRDGGIAAGFEWINVAVDRSGLGPAADLRLFMAYRRMLRGVRPAAFLGFTIKPNIYGCIAARTLGIPAIANISGLGTAFIRKGPLSLLVKAMYRVALARACVVFFQNADDLDLFVARGIVGRAQARLIPGSGIDLDRFKAAPLPRGPVTFLLIARLLGDKGVREFVEAASIVRADFPGARFQLLGGLDAGNRTSISATELEGWVNSGLVDYLGEAPDVRPSISNATAIVLPSYREGLPRTLLEGAAMARPLIATNVPGCRSVVEEGVNGLLCEPRDAGSLADAMQKFLRLSREEQSAMGLAGRTKVEKQFDQAIVADAYIDALKDCAAQG